MIAVRAGMDFSFLVSCCISGFSFHRLAWHPAAPGNSLCVCCVAPYSPGPVLADLNKENLTPTSTHCQHWQPFFHLLVPQLQGTPFANITCSLQGFRAKGSCVSPKAAKTVQPAVIKGLDDCQDERDWLPASPLSSHRDAAASILLQLFAALVRASVLWGSSMLLESSLRSASYRS